MRIKSFEEYLSTYRKSVEDPEAFWSGIAQEFHWRKLWKRTLDWDFNDLDVQWFIGGKLNITENCLDRHVLTNPDKVAIIWESNEPTDIFVKLTYRELYEKVCQFANVLKNNGVKKGDRVCIYMPMVPEAAIAMLACARIGAIHSVVFAQFACR